MAGLPPAMLFRGGYKPTDQGATEWRIPSDARRSRTASSRAICWSRLNKILLAILIGSLIGLWYRTRNLWPPTSPDAVINRNDYVNPDTLSNDPDLDPLPRVTAQAFFDIEIDKEYVGRVVMGVFGDTVPKTANNFLALCSGENGSNLNFKNMRFHRIIQGFIVQGGDITRKDGSGSTSIYGPQFDDEPAGLELKHDRPYLLQMANSGRNTNGSQFCFMLGAAPHLNGRHVVFGRVLSGFHIIDKMGLTGGAGELPTKDVVVVDSGIVHPPS